MKLHCTPNKPRNTLLGCQPDVLQTGAKMYFSLSFKLNMTLLYIEGLTNSVHPQNAVLQFNLCIDLNAD